MKAPRRGRARWGLGVLGLVAIPVGVALIYELEGGRSHGHGVATDSLSRQPERSAAPGTTRAVPSDPVRRSDAVSRSAPRRARELLREELETHPDRVAALERLGEKRLNDEAHAEARQLALRCLALDPGNARCEAVLDNTLPPPDEGRAVFLDNCLARRPDDAACLAGRLAEHIKAGHFDAARDLLARLRATDPAGTMTRLSAARLLASSGNYEQAATEFEALCKQDNAHACYRARTLHAEGW